jgi:stage V sporulation protein B
LIGEIASTLVALSFFHIQTEETSLHTFRPEFRYVKDLVRMALPLTASRMVLHLFAATENGMLPAKLRVYGYSASEALSVFGVLSGMAMSIVLFPSVITNSFSVLLMPAISEADAAGNDTLILSTIRKSIAFSLVFGFACTAGFLLTGKLLGDLLFQNALAGDFITTLGWICPFLYLTATLNSILHGLGHTSLTCFLNVCACIVRILFVLFAVPRFGIKSYLIAILLGHMTSAFLALVILFPRYKKRP